MRERRDRTTPGRVGGAVLDDISIWVGEVDCPPQCGHHPNHVGPRQSKTERKGEFTLFT